MYISSLKQLSYGMYVVCTKNENTFAGCVINTCMQISAEKPTIAISLNKNNHTTTTIKNGTKISINILKESTSPEIIGEFGFKSSKSVNKFENINSTIINGLPILNDICGYLIVKAIQIVDAGTHNLILCEVETGEQLTQDPPMTYNYYQTVIKGKSPKNAPTYINEDVKSGYKCPICGYEYTIADPKFEDLPDSWVCPICGVPKSVFVKI